MRENTTRERTLVAAGLALAFVAYVKFADHYFPLPSGRVGLDYGYFMTQLQLGEYWWRTNGSWAVPWFTPGACGGLPLLADPQSLYYSLPQALAIGLGPVPAVEATMLAGAAFGATTTYLLLRQRFQVSAAAAGLAAVIWLFNGFYAFQLAMGHLTYHTVAVVPAIAWLALDPGPAGRVRAAGLVAAIALLIAAIFHGGGANTLVPAGLMVAAIGCLHQLRHGPRRRFWLLAGGGAGLAAGLAAIKLAPALAYLAAFPRDDVPFELFDSPWRGLAFLAWSLFWPGLVHGEGAHELEMGVSVVPAILLLLAAPGAAGRLAGLPRWPLAGLALILLLPLPLTIGGADWAAFLKTVPYLKTTSSPTRWWSLYIPVLAVVSGLILDRLAGSRRLAWAALAATVVVAQFMARAAPVYEQPGLTMDPGPLTAAHAAIAAGQPAPPITRIAAAPNLAAMAALPVTGWSPFPCYQPMFGYDLHAFPRGSLGEGPALDERAGLLNLKNPACFLYGAANDCRPGDHLTADRRRDAEDFLAWRPLPFVQPWWQRAATALSLASLAACLGLLAAWAIQRSRRR